MVRLRLLAPILAVAALALAPGGAHAAKARYLLPDLDQAPVGCPGGFAGNPLQCKDWDICMVADASDPGADCQTSGDIQAVRLRFTSSEDNVGDGPLLIYGHRAAGAPHMTARQALERTDGKIPQTYSQAQVAVASPASNYLYYEPSYAHRHWHLQNFEHFQLRSTSGATIVRDVKNGVCLGDRYSAAGAKHLKHLPGDGSTPVAKLAHDLGHWDPQERPNTFNCHLGQTQDSPLVGLREGISVGEGDDYDYRVDYQWLDVTHVPSGQYLIVNEVNAQHALREKRYSNNVASMLISVQWQGGATDPPAEVTTPPLITMLNSCPNSATCTAPKARAARANTARVAYGDGDYNCPLHDRLISAPV